MVFKNKVALVTGAARGMGLATAQAFAEAGASLMISHALVVDGGFTAQEDERLNGRRALQR